MKGTIVHNLCNALYEAVVERGLEGVVANIPPHEQQDWTWETLAWSQ